MNRNAVAHAIASVRWMITPDGMRRILTQIPDRIEGDLFAFRPEAAAARTRPPRSGSVAVVQVRGPIVRYDSWFTMIFGGTSVEWLGQQVRELASDESVGSILLDVDSPGGTVSGLPELAAILRQAREAKPLIAITNDLNCSAAYWLAAQADEIVSTPEGLTGSVGVYMAHEDLSAMYADFGIKVTFIQAGKYKTEGNEAEPLSDEAREHFQGLIDDAYALFLADVATGRGVTVGQVRDGYGEGRAFAAKDAKAKGMVDRIGTFADAVGRAASGKVARRALDASDAAQRFAEAIEGGRIPESDPALDSHEDPAFAFERERRQRAGLRPV